MEAQIATAALPPPRTIANGYVVKTRFLTPEVCALLFDCFALRRATGRLLAPDAQVPGAPRMYGDLMTETLLVQQQPQVEEALGVALLPTYSYLRVHGHGDRLGVHTDRPTCEITLSINIGGDAQWPLWLRAPDGDRALCLGVGDAVIFEGMSLPHWRDAFDGTIQIQCLLHYVCEHGPYAALKYDGRKGAGHKYEERA
jgi:hypothetical protein